MRQVASLLLFLSTVVACSGGDSPGPQNGVDGGVSADSGAAALDMQGAQDMFASDSAMPTDGAIAFDAEPSGPPLCTPALPSATADVLPWEPLASRELTGSGSATFTSVARADSSGECSNDYSRVDFCFNRENPPAPSITRRVGQSRANDTSDRTIPYRMEGVAEPASAGRAGDTNVMPFLRSSNDGRILLDGRYRTWPHLFVHRPESYAGDFRRAGEQAVASEAAAELHMLAWFDPAHTSFPVSSSSEGGAQVSRLLGSVDALHSTICDDSSSREAAGRRNPTPCFARYGDFAYDSASASESDLEEQPGVCYRLTFLVGMSDQDRWELRSAPLTIFVPNALRTTTGQTAWVYPENPDGAWDRPDETGAVTLPDYADFDLGRLFPWNRVSVPMNVLGAVTSASVDMGNAVATPALCWERDGLRGYRKAAGAPKWCQFIYGQHRATEIALDTNRNAVAERPSTHPSASFTRWSGERSVHFMFELMTTGDGRVLFVNENNALYYSVNEAGACRADGFSAWLPISLIPTDPMMRASATHPGYDLANVTGGRPFRDPSGRDIPFGSLHHFAYPWVDRAGSNLFFSMVNEQRDAYFPTSIDRVPTDARVPPGTITPLADQEAEQSHRLSGMNTRAAHQIGFVGAWSQGKMVTLDNGLNASDLGGLRAFGTSSATGDVVQYEHAYTLPLYRDRSLTFIPKGASIIGSYENQFGMFDALRPRLPFDVVWAMSGNNQTTSEVAFDEFLDRRAWLVLHMNASLRFYDNLAVRSPHSASLVAVEDGFYAPPAARWTDNPDYAFNTSSVRDGEPSARAILQNAAPLSPVNQVRLRGGARVEPVALGGVLGRGVYFDGNNDFADLGFPLEDHHAWYFGAWIDARQSNYVSDRRRELFHFADGSFFGLLERNGRYDFIASPRDATEERIVHLGSLITPGRYAHIGVRVSGSATNREVELFVNGTSAASVTFSGSAAQGLSPMADCSAPCGESSWMSIGRPDTGPNGSWTFEGWLDDVKIYRLRADDLVRGGTFDETQCNLALGTLVRGAALPSLQETFRSNVGVMPERVCEQLVLASTDEPVDIAPQRGRTLCAERVHRVLGDDCLRPGLFGLLDLRAAIPRADASATSFCLTCHTASNTVHGLGLEALARGAGPRYRDRRRQPMDPPAVMSLPPFECPGFALEGTSYSAFPRSTSALRPDGSWSIDRVIDEFVAGPGRYFPPQP